MDYRKYLKQAPSGSWYIRKRFNGKQVYINFTHKPANYEIEQKIFGIQMNNRPNMKGTFKNYADDYISSKSNVLSPSTIESYKSIIRNLSPAFLGKKMADITQVDVQKEINQYTTTRSAKSTKNANGFISAVMGFYRPDLVLKTRISKTASKKVRIPTDDEVKIIINEVRGTEYELPTLLAICGLRRSELLAVTDKDLDQNNMLTIARSLVKSEDGYRIKESNKTVSSTRKIWIPNDIADLLREKKVVYTGFPNNIYRNLVRIQNKYGMEHFTLHALRHYYISYAHAQGIPDASIAATVGHKNTNTTRAVYLHAQQEHQTELQKKVADSLFKNIE